MRDRLSLEGRLLAHWRRGGSGIAWAGSGFTAVLGAPMESLPGALEDPRRGLRWLECEEFRDRGAGDAGAWLRAAIGDYFASGGRRLVVCVDSRFDETLVPWFGEEGAPGDGVGVPLLEAIEDVGTIVFARPLDSAAILVLEGLVARYPRILFLAEASFPGLEGARRAWEWRAANFAVHRRSPLGVPAPSAVLSTPSAVLSTPSAVLPGPAALAAWLDERVESCDSTFDDRAPELPIEADSFDVRRFLGFRLEEGLRRSVDLGTRWLLFEPRDAFLARRVERDVSAFLWRLVRQGIVDASEGDPPFEVVCGPPSPDRAGWAGSEGRSLEVTGPVGDGRLEIRVKARLRVDRASRRGIRSEGTRDAPAMASSG